MCLYSSVITASLTSGRRLDSQTVAPEVGAAVAHCAIAEQITVADGIQVRHGAPIIPALTAAPSPLTV